MISASDYARSPPGGTGMGSHSCDSVLAHAAFGSVMVTGESGPDMTSRGQIKTVF